MLPQGNGLQKILDTHAGLERVGVRVLVALFVLTPLISTECFPFSRFPMFSDTPRTLIQSQVHTFHGELLSLEKLGILEVYVANAKPLLNIVPQRPLEAAYRFWRVEEFAPALQDRILRGEVSAPLYFTQQLIGVRENASPSTPGVLDERTWEVRADSVTLVVP